jgi:hypothetical protein
VDLASTVVISFGSISANAVDRASAAEAVSVTTVRLLAGSAQRPVVGLKR